MEIKQFEDKNLAHYSYAIMSGGEIALIDPARDPQPYYDYAKQHKATIRAVIETHPHADFVSSHLEIHRESSALIYTSKLAGAEYPHLSFDEGDELTFGNIILRPLNTPGHSPDSISVLVLDKAGKQRAVFTGDTLFIGDCGRPDLREKAGAITAEKKVLAAQMYHSLRNKMLSLSDDTLVYPAHGAGSLCGKNLSSQNSSTIGAEKISNWSLQEMTEQEFVSKLLEDQPFIPKYFPFDVAVNKKGADKFSAARERILETRLDEISALREIPIIDTRPEKKFKSGHLKSAYNLMDDKVFETWLGSIVAPGEEFYLLAEDEESLNRIAGRIPKIGYERQVSGVLAGNFGTEKMDLFDSGRLVQNEHAFTIVDVRGVPEVKTRKIFRDSINIPLQELRERVGEVPADKPVVVHCAGGYRSAAGSSIIRAALDKKVAVYDLGDAIKDF